MNWFSELLTEPSVLQAVIYLSLICSLGLALGQIKIKGVSLGVTLVFFAGILLGHISDRTGLRLDPQMVSLAQNFGLILFVYTLGIQVGPGFFTSLRQGGVRLNVLGIIGLVATTGTALAFMAFKNVSLSDAMGLLCGATTNTPALGAAQQALSNAHLSSSGAALGCAVTYPLGVVGVIFAMILLRKFFVTPDDLQPHNANDEDQTFVGQFVVVNPAIAGKTLAKVSQMTHNHFIVSRIWRGDDVIVPNASTIIQSGDNVLVVTRRDEVSAMEVLFGKRVEKNWNRDHIDWNAIDSSVESRVVVMTRTKLNGKPLGSLHMRQIYGVNISRVMRGDIKLLATDSLHLQYGDRVTVVGTPDNINHAASFLGNAIQDLNEPNLSAIFFGLLLGLAVGMIPFSIPGMSTPVKLGIAGGPIIMGIIIGALGSRAHFISYTTRSASLMLRKFGLSLYLACLGLAAGKDFFATIIRPEGLLWVGVGFLLTVLPLIIIGVIALKTKKFDFGTICGLLCGAMANPMALSYANETIKGDRASVAYTSVYPLGMFVRVIIAQVIIMFLV